MNCPNNFKFPFFTAILVASFLFSCNNTEKKPTTIVIEANHDSVASKIQPLVVATASDTLTISQVKEVLSDLKNKDFKTLETIIHPKIGVRFSPYGYVDTISDKKFSATDFLKMATSDTLKKINWGSYDATGDVINLTFKAYFSKFIYSADFLNAPQLSLNKRKSVGNSTNNISSVYKGCEFSESYFSGTDKKLSGLDWSALRLIFKKFHNKFYLVGIVHDQWTS